MKKFLLITAAILAIGITAQAGTVSQKEARQTALKFFKKAMNKQGKRLLSTGRQISSSAITLEQARSEGDTPLYYIYNLGNGDGFAIVSAVEETPQILGYSLNGNIDADNMPSNMKAFMDNYAKSLKALADDPELAAKTMEEISSISTEERVSVDTLIKTKWGQKFPYYLMCPTVNGTHCVTGCVATATAQLFKYYNEKEGWFAASKKIEEIDTLESTTFDYANCKYRYNVEDTTAEAEADTMKAVAKLMHYCGVATRMDYGLSESGANAKNLAYFINKYFIGNDDIKAVFYNRENFTNRQWDSIAYNEICAKRPIIISGKDRQGSGHAFICDGYNADEQKYHINWGWNNKDDGYFDLFLLIIPSKDRNYSMMNKFITVMPAEEAEKATPTKLSVKSLSQSFKTNKIAGLNKRWKITWEVDNHTDSIIDIYPGIVVTDPAGNKLFSHCLDTLWQAKPLTNTKKALILNPKTICKNIQNKGVNCDYYKLNFTIDKKCKILLDDKNCYNYYFSFTKDSFYLHPNVSLEWSLYDKDDTAAFVNAEILIKKMPQETKPVYAIAQVGNLFYFEKEVTDTEAKYTVKVVKKDATNNYGVDSIKLANGIYLGNIYHSKLDNITGVYSTNMSGIQRLGKGSYFLKSDTMKLTASLRKRNSADLSQWENHSNMVKSFFLSRISGIRPVCAFSATKTFNADSSKIKISRILAKAELIDSIKSHGLTGDTLRLSVAVDSLGYFRPQQYQYYNYFICYDAEKDTVYLMSDIKASSKPEYNADTDSFYIKIKPAFTTKYPLHNGLNALLNLTLINGNDTCWTGNSQAKTIPLTNGRGICAIGPEAEYANTLSAGTYRYILKTENGIIIDRGTITIDSSTAIKETEAEAEEKTAKGIYNLRGQKIQNEPQQGLYIKNGKVTAPKRQ